MKFGEVIEELKLGKLARRGSWAEGICAVGCPDVYTSNVNCIPASAKLKVFNASSGKVKVSGSVKLIHVSNPGMFNSSVSISDYVPTWEDIFAEDWELD